MRKRGIRKKLAKAVGYSRTLVRVKHFRGRKVHSPFVYGIVRNAIMKTQPLEDDRTLFDELRYRGFSIKRAAQLQNLYTFQRYESTIFADNDQFSILSPSALSAPPLCGDLRASVDEAFNFQFSINTLCFLMPSLSDSDTLALVESAKGTGGVLCLVWPYETRGRRFLARSLVASHRHTSVDNRGFILLFTDERLPKQHFKL